MSSPFPCEWQVFKGSEYLTFRRATMEDGNMGAVLLVPLDDKHQITGRFRIQVIGEGNIYIRIPAHAVVPGLPDFGTNYFLELACNTQDVTFEQDSVVGRWRDVEELIRARLIGVTDEEGHALGPDRLLSALQVQATEKTCVGASIRWAIGVSENKTLQLELQGLPTQAKYLHKANLKGENAISVLHRAFPLASDMFDGQSASGMVPMFFAEDQAGAFTSLTNHPAKVLEGISRINARLLHMEHMSLTEARAYLQRKQRAARGTLAFPPSKHPVSKRPRVAFNTGEDPGRTIFAYRC